MTSRLLRRCSQSGLSINRRYNNSIKDKGPNVAVMAVDETVRICSTGLRSHAFDIGTRVHAIVGWGKHPPLCTSPR